ncbi:MAG: CBS domain-containing protein [Actinomycetia bacterium]|nr:CBS domain-containing protein [Actinomycetes bacterium]
MIVSTIMKKNVVTISGDSIIEDAANLMEKQAVRSLIVVDNDNVTGILTDSDIIFRVLGRGKGPSDVKVNEVMTKNPSVINSDSDIFEAVKLMEKNRFRRLPVLKNKKLIGIISVGDLAANILVRLELLRSQAG